MIFVRPWTGWLLERQEAIGAQHMGCESQRSTASASRRSYPADLPNDTGNAQLAR